jgi:nucleotide-binding universal stress UspA family protein
MASSALSTRGRRLGPRRFHLGRILVASDLGAKSGRVLEVAIELAREVNAAMEIVHVDDPVSAVFDAPLPVFEAGLRLVDDAGSEGSAERIANIDQHLAAQAQRARDRGVVCVTTSLAGHPASEVVAHMRKISVDLVVLGVERWRLPASSREPVGLAVARHAPTPTLLVPL